MSGGAAFDVKKRVKQAVDIVDLVGAYLPLRREGRLFKALCPWHDDSRPSLQVNPDRQSFKCWVCNLGGDVFSFVMKVEGVEFPEALRMLADRAGIRLDTQRGEPAPADDKRNMYRAMAWAVGEYHQFLLRDERAAAARDYLLKRQLTLESLRQFQIGFAPDDWAWMTERVRDTPFSLAMLERIGVVSRRKNGPGHYDRFKGRVLFPIFDSQARAVGLGGRVLPQNAPTDAAKYVNSPETPLFSKSNLLYGLNTARETIRKSGTVLVTEGYTDCIAAHQSGFANTVAVLGTALGASHIQLLRRFADRLRVVLVLDGDEAGRKRAKEVLELFVVGNVDLRVLTLPDEMDPAEYLFQFGPEKFAELVESAVDGLSHAFQSATAGIDLRTDLHAATSALEQLVATIAKAPRAASDTETAHRLREYSFLQQLARDFRVPEEQVRKLMTEVRRKSASRAAPVPQTNASTTEKPNALDRELVEILVRHPQMIEPIAVAIAPAELLSAACRRVLEECLQLWHAGILPEFSRLLLEIEDPQVKNLIVEIDEIAQRKGAAELDARMADVLAGFARRRQEPWLRGQTSALKNRQLTEEDQLAVLLELEQHAKARQQQQTDRARHGISESTEG